MTPLRDLTGGRPNIPIAVVTSPLHELVMVGWVLSDKENLEGHEHGSDLFDAVRSRLTADELAVLERASVAGGALWLSMHAVLSDLGETAIGVDGERGDPAAAIEELARLLETGPAERVRTAVLAMLPCETGNDVAAAAAGDSEALDRVAARVVDLHPEKRDMVGEIRTLLSLAGDELATLGAAAVRALGNAALDHLERVSPALIRSAADARTLAITTPAERVVEQVTKGIEYQVRPGIDQIRLVPSAAVRPWSLLLEDGSTQVFVYPVDEELLGDPDTPPAWLISVYKALADERRLRILRRISGGGASFAELVDHLDLAKSTVHHHIGILRSAGLVRVTIDSGKDTIYRLRAGVLPDAEQRLAHYLTESHTQGDTT